jgi:hypothetical protein
MTNFTTDIASILSVHKNIKKIVMKTIIFSLLFLLPVFSYSQIDTSFFTKIKSLDSANILRIDTAAVPNDSFTKKIKQLRKEKQGLNLETVLELKLMEQQKSDTGHSKEFYDRLHAEITTGNTGRLIENSLVNLYRRLYTEQEIADLIKFYKTSAGKKMDKEYILLMVESIKDAEQLLKTAFATLEHIGN